jgi:16S rRNA (uracil1498-N3)-methyltransferase
MTRRRWIADQTSGNHAALIGEHARHLAQVLRAHIGQEFEISTGTEVRLGRICDIQPDRVEFDLGPSLGRDNGLPITVALSIFKFDRMEWAIEKCVELGVTRIVPVIAARTDSHLSSAAVKRIERWKRIAKQASEQSRRSSAPEISSPLRLSQLLAETHGTRLVFSEVEEQTTLTEAIPKPVDPLTLAFGPEGGWKEEELARFKAAGWASASLGPTILRTETAVIAAVAVLHSVFQTGHRSSQNQPNPDN